MEQSNISVKWRRQVEEGWLKRNIPYEFAPLFTHDRIDEIEEYAARANSEGKQPLWEGYKAVYKEGVSPPFERNANQVRTNNNVGRFYSWLIQQRSPDVVIEFGTAFGVSGMYWLLGLEHNDKGLLLTFEPNDIWRKIAVQNLMAIGQRFVSISGIFEEKIKTISLPETGIDIAFVDAIHTSEFVYPQVEIVKSYMKRGGIIVMDDIRFSADMIDCWNDLSTRDDVIGSFELGRRVGLIEFAG